MSRITRILAGIAMFIAVATFIGCSDGGSTTSNLPSSAPGIPSAPKWYEGGTLHKKSAIEWQAASSKDKLATCADFVAALWKSGNLKPSIADQLSTVDDLRPYAQELVDFLDAAFKPDPDPEQNRQLFANQTVLSAAVIGMVKMGWTKQTLNQALNPTGNRPGS